MYFYDCVTLLLLSFPTFFTRVIPYLTVYDARLVFFFTKANAVVLNVPLVASATLACCIK